MINIQTIATNSEVKTIATSWYLQVPKLAFETKRMHNHNYCIVHLVHTAQVSSF